MMERIFPWAMVAATILLTSYGQLILKWEVGRQTPPLFAAMKDWPALLQLIVRPGVISALVAAFGASVCWMIALQKLELSHAYPFMSLTFLVVAVGSAGLFNEPITTFKAAGLALIMIGLAVLSKG